VAYDLLTQRLTAESPGWISTVVLAETAWVLRRVYGHSSDGVLEMIDGLLATSVLVLESEDAVNDAVSDARQYGASFADVLIAGLARRVGCSTTLTFDRRAARLPGFELAS
jgi:predicted nucleic-acid-binding protein